MTLPISGKDILYPPVHDYQNWEEYNPENFNLKDEEEYIYQNEWHSVYTIQLGELIESGIFDWSKPYLDWSSAAYNEEQYERVCEYFKQRFMFREISTLPIKEWFMILKRKLVYELMPKYIPLYERIEDGINPLQSGNEYYKNRRITSSYPETLLSENADYITDGLDEEHQKITEMGILDALTKYVEEYHGVDQLLLDELESMFICMYTSNVNSW